jgi:hypothetical protein
VGENERTIETYKFYLSIENSNCKDYITEKLERAFQWGVVPVVDGAPRMDYETFIPNHDSIIHVDDFESIEDLASYLKHLIKNDSEYYNRHLAYRWNTSLITNQAFRAKPLKKTWLPMDEQLGPFCEMCDLAHDIKSGRSNKWLVKDIQPAGYPDDTCFINKWQYV